MPPDNTGRRRWQRAERRVEVIEARVGERERQAGHAKLLLDYIVRGGIRAKAAAHPKQAAPTVPDAVAGTFERHPIGHLYDLIEEPVRLQGAEAGRDYRLLAPAFGMEKTSQDGLAVQHDRGVGGEHEIGKAWLGLDGFDCGVSREQRAVEAGPLPCGRSMQQLAAVGPGARIHPGIDAVGDRKILRAAH